MDARAGAEWRAREWWSSRRRWWCRAAAVPSLLRRGHGGDWLRKVGRWEKMPWRWAGSWFGNSRSFVLLGVSERVDRLHPTLRSLKKEILYNHRLHALLNFIRRMPCWIFNWLYRAATILSAVKLTKPFYLKWSGGKQTGLWPFQTSLTRFGVTLEECGREKFAV